MGRPKEFNPEEAVDAAMRLFWQQGYEATTLSDLTSAMNITRTSLYHTFGNKEELFGKALSRYQSKHLSFIGVAFAQQTVVELVTIMLRGFADINTEPGTPAGCLVTNAALAGTDHVDNIRRCLIVEREQVERAVTDRIAKAQLQGEVSLADDPEALASTVMIFIYGMSIQAASGASRKALHRAVDQFLMTWLRA